MTTKYGSPIIGGAPAALVAAFAFCSLTIGSAHAKTYKYTGQVYSTTQGGTCLTTSMNVTASFSVKGKLPTNASNLTVTPLTWRISDGLNNANSKAQPGALQIVVSTDANGAINAWAIDTTFSNKKGQEIEIGTTSQPAFNFAGDDALDGACKSGTSEAFNSVAGTW